MEFLVDGPCFYKKHSLRSPNEKARVIFYISDGIVSSMVKKGKTKKKLKNQPPPIGKKKTKKQKAVDNRLS